MRLKFHNFKKIVLSKIAIKVIFIYLKVIGEFYINNYYFTSMIKSLELITYSMNSEFDVLENEIRIL